MGFGQGARAKLWGITEDSGKFATCNISINKKVGEEWKKDFSSKYVKFVGEAYKKVKEVSIPKDGVKIKLGSCTVENCYDKDGQTTYLKSWRPTVFDFEWVDGTPQSQSSGQLEGNTDFMNIADGIDEDVPFQ